MLNGKDGASQKPIVVSGKGDVKRVWGQVTESATPAKLRPWRKSTAETPFRTRIMMQVRAEDSRVVDVQFNTAYTPANIRVYQKK